MITHLRKDFLKEKKVVIALKEQNGIMFGINFKYIDGKSLIEFW